MPAPELDISDSSPCICRADRWLNASPRPTPGAVAQHACADFRNGWNSRPRLRRRNSRPAVSDADQ